MFFSLCWWQLIICHQVVITWSTCDVFDCIAQLLNYFVPWNNIFKTYVIWKCGQLNLSWVSDSQCDCIYVLVTYKLTFLNSLEFKNCEINCYILKGPKTVINYFIESHYHLIKGFKLLYPDTMVNWLGYAKGLTQKSPPLCLWLMHGADSSTGDLPFNYSNQS